MAWPPEKTRAVESSTHSVGDAPPRGPAPSEAPGAGVDGGPRRQRGRRALRTLAYLCITVVVALLASVTVELANALSDPFYPPSIRLPALQLDLLLLGAVLTWAFLILVLSVLGRLWIAAAVVLTTAAALAVMNAYKMQFRVEPVYPSDLEYLADPGFLVAMVGPGRALGMAAALLAIPTACYGTAVLVRRRSGRRSRVDDAMSRRTRLIVRGTAGLLSAGLLFSASNFHEPGNLVGEVYTRAGVTWHDWDQTTNYLENGFVSGLLYNTATPAMQEPDGYSATTMKNLAARYQRAASTINASRDPEALSDTNVLLVLGESFSDPARLQGVRLETDPIPFTRRLMESTTSGTLLSLAYGGGTANVEFEVLTGMSASLFAPQLHSPYQMLVSQQHEFPSMVRALASPDHQLTAIHPYYASFYRRSEAYAALGFRASEFLTQMTHEDRLENDPYVSDDATFREVLDDLRATDEPIVMNVVTMQNHRPFAGRYEDPIRARGPFEPSETLELRQYLRGLRYSDAAVQHLVRDLRRLPERTVVLYYGDHLPDVWPQEVLERNSRLAMYETPYFVWANFETERLESRGVIGPNLLMNQLLNATNAPLSPYNALLERIADETPALGPPMAVGPAGRPISGDDLSPAAQRLLRDYRLVQYDLSVGQRYSAQAMLELPATFDAVNAPSP